MLDIGLIEIGDTPSPTSASTTTIVATGDSGEPQAQRISASEHNLLQRASIAKKKDEHVQLEVEDAGTNTFVNSGDGNAVRNVLESLDRRTRQAGRSGLPSNINRLQAIESTQPRDIVFVVDLSGSMNDDTENAWATKSIEDRFEGTEFANVGENLVQQFYTDMNFGSYPGTLDYIGKPLGGIPASSDAYNQMTKNGGKLTTSAIVDKYRIKNSDNEETRKIKAYKWMIDKQIAVVMPAVKPAPNESNYDYWEKYLDYIMVVKYVGNTKKKKRKKKKISGGGDGGPGGPIPSVGQNQVDGLPQTYASILAQAQPMARFKDRGWIPPNVDSDRIYKFNNPNLSAYPSGDKDTRWQLRNKIGYRTYTQFLMDWGRDGKPDGRSYVESSVNSAHCPFHDEKINDEVFSFPPRTQPMNSVRRGMIAALQVIRDRNEEFGMTSQRDLVAIMTFDSPENGITIQQTLTDDYETAMDQCCKLQATQDIGSSTATEIGLQHAYQYLRPVSDGGVGREGANKVVVLLTDGLPNAHVTSKNDIDVFMQANSDEEDFYGGGHYWLDAALMQGKIMQADNWYIYPVGIGFGTDYDFMDRLARIGSTAVGGAAMRGTGNPAQYEKSLEMMFNEIMISTKVSFAK